MHSRAKLTHNVRGQPRVMSIPVVGPAVQPVPAPVIPVRRGNPAAGLRCLHDMHRVAERDVDYIDMHEEFGSGELAIRPIYVKNTRYTRHDIRVENARGAEMIKIREYGDEFHAVSFTFGNYVGDGVSVSESMLNVYPNMKDLVMRAKMVSGLLHNISNTAGVAPRWISAHYNVTIPNLNLFLRDRDDRILVRSQSNNLRHLNVRIRCVGDWLYACFIARLQNTQTSLNLRLLLEALTVLICEEEDVPFRDLVVSIENWIVTTGCDSCMRAVLRTTDQANIMRMDYPFAYWERRQGARVISTDDMEFEWVLEPHGNTLTVGKILEYLGQHDFLVLKTTKSHVKVSIITPNGTRELLIMAAHFHLLAFAMDGFFHHLRGIVLADTDKGLNEWRDRVSRRFPNYALRLFDTYKALGILRGDSKLRPIADVLRIWMLTGRIFKDIIRKVMDNRDVDMFQMMMLSMSEYRLTATVLTYYQLLEPQVDGDFIFFSHED